jgi:hypothetical protein
MMRRFAVALALACSASFWMAGPGVARQASAPPPIVPAPPAAPCVQPEFRQMDFWVGDWDLTFDAGNGVVGHATEHITRDEFGACVVYEHFAVPAVNTLGASWSSYDRFKHVWRQTWVDNNGAHMTLEGGPVTGQPYIFELKTIYPIGPNQSHFRMIWEQADADTLTWRWQVMNADGGYSDAWVQHYRRAKRLTPVGAQR